MIKCNNLHDDIWGIPPIDRAIGFILRFHLFDLLERRQGFIRHDILTYHIPEPFC